MGNPLTKAVGNVLTKLMGNVLTEQVGKVLDIYKERWEVTIECINPPRTQFICEDCIESKNKKATKDKEGVIELHAAA